jgi:hypothetical protein
VARAALIALALCAAGCWRAAIGVDAGEAGADFCANSANVPPGVDCGCAVPSTVPAPRPLAPISTSVVTSRRPTLRWVLAPGTDGAVVDLCRTRGCGVGDTVSTTDVAGTSFQPPADLAPGVWFWRLRGRAGGASGMCSGLTWEFTVGARSAAVSTSYGAVMDVDGDGRADVLAGAPLDLDGAGSVYVYRSGAGGLAAAPQVLSGADPGGHFGAAVASAGDVNGDGYGDALVGANWAAGRAGRMYLFLGGPTGLLAPAAA